MSDEHHEEAEPRDDSIVIESVTEEQMVVRRTPRYWRFMLLGAVVFAVAAFIATYSLPQSGDYSRNTVFGFVLLAAVALGIAVGALIALLAELITRRSRREVTAEVVQVAETEPPQE